MGRGFMQNEAGEWVPYDTDYAEDGLGYTARPMGYDAIVAKTAMQVQQYNDQCNATAAVNNTPRGFARTFASGATRDTDVDKLDFEGFLSPRVLEAFAKYMHAKRKMPDGSMRDSDNWQKGIPLEAYMKSMFRHFFAVWAGYRNPEHTVDDALEELLALLFNVQGMIHETLKQVEYAPPR